MGRRIVCDCGEVLGINLFSGNNVLFLVDEDTIERIEGGAEIHMALARGNHVVGCSKCQRHFLYSPGGRLLGVFTFVPVPKDGEMQDEP